MSTRQPHTRFRWAARGSAFVVSGLTFLWIPAAAWAEDPAGTAQLKAVIGNVQTFVMAILAALATLFLVLAGVYWATAGGDPSQVDKAKSALRNALVGYGLAILAPILLLGLQWIVKV